MLVLDANILMRAVLGKRARALLAKYGERVEFDEARKRLPEVIARRNLDSVPFLEYLASLATVVRTVEFPISFGCGVATWTSDRVELYLMQS